MKIVPEWLRERRQGRGVGQAIQDAENKGSHVFITQDPIGQEHSYYTSRGWDDSHREELLRDVAFNNHEMNDGEHISPFDNDRVQVGADGIKVALVQGIPDTFVKVLGMATRATIGIDLNKTSVADITANDDADEMLHGGLQTALEDAVIVFAVSGVSRTCTHQLVRTRQAAFHQQSQRASYYGDAPEARMPESVWLNMPARQAWMAAKAASDLAYQVACENGISYQDARYVLLEGTDNYIMCEYSVREFMKVFDYRGCSMFSWEIVSVMRMMRDALIAEYPWLEPYIKISCEKTSPSSVFVDGPAGNGSELEHFEHKCTFQGWESVEGQCPFSWAKERNRTFQPKLHKIASRAEKRESTDLLVDDKPVAQIHREPQDEWAERMLLGVPLSRPAMSDEEVEETRAMYYKGGQGYRISKPLVSQLLSAYGKLRLFAADTLNVNPNDHVCQTCGRDNRNGSHNALEMHLNHEFAGINPEQFCAENLITLNV